MTDTYSEQRAEETQAILTSCHAILSNDHFVYISGQHGSGWIDKDAIFVDPATSSGWPGYWRRRFGSSRPKSSAAPRRGD